MKKEITIIGAGPCGMVLALLLVKLGYHIKLFEKADLKSHTTILKRATQLDLSARAYLALKEAGVLEKVLSKAVATYGRVIYFSPKKILTIPHGPKKNLIYNITRNDLHKVLLKTIHETPNIDIYFSHQLIHADIENGLLSFAIDHKDGTAKIKTSCIIGCDGVNSILRKALNNPNPPAKKYTHEYKDLTIPADFAKTHLHQNYMYKWVGKNIAFLAHPKIDGDFSGTLILPEQGTNSFDHFNPKLFIKNFPFFKTIAETLIEQVATHPLGWLKMLKVRTQFHHRVLLLGDAAHSMLPFLGQGVNCALEDSRLFYETLKKIADFELAVKAYATRRIQDSNAIVDMSENEYIELAPDSDIDDMLHIEELKLALQKQYPADFTPYRQLLYFTHQPYSEIQKIRNAQAKLLRVLCI